MEIDDYLVAPDETLVAYALEGDSTAFEHLFNRYRHGLHQLYMVRTGRNAGDADDILQETFVKVYLNLNRFNPSYTFTQWIYTIARNTFVDHTRRRNDMIVSFEQSSDWGTRAPVSTQPTPEESMIKTQSSAQLEQFIGSMRPRYRKLVELRFFRELSYEEIAEELSLPLGTVKTQIHRAREQLCKFITDSEDGK